jgi:tetratricopeptide (TPR) repeat protein
MFTDIVGFTDLMSNDESKALITLQKKISTVQSEISNCNGVYVKDIGDGTLSYFDSATKAVDCAIKIQKSLQNKISVRIGIHLGEIIHKDGDIFGDSVNIANRIEKISEPGGVCISSSIFDQLKNKKIYKFKHLGLHSFKGVGKLLDIYGFKTSESVGQDNQSFEIINQYSSNRLPSLLLIPFRNKGKTEDDFYSYSLSLDIFSKIYLSSNIILPSMEEVESLIATKSSKEILNMLKMRYSFTGSLWKKENRFHLSVELFDSKNNKMVWVDSWLENWENLPEIEQKISNNVIKILDNQSIQKTQNEDKVTTIDSEAYRVYLKGKYIYHNRLSDKDILKSKTYFEKSMDLDQKLIQPRMLLGEIYFNQGRYDKSLEVYENNLKMSMNLNDSKNIANSFSSIAAVNFQKGNYDKSLEYNLQALKIQEKINNKKGIAKSINSIGAIHYVLREYDKALECYKNSIEISKEINDKYGIARGTVNISNLYNTTGELSRALTMQKESVQLYKKSNNQPLLAYSYNLGGIIYSGLHKYDEAIKNLKKCLKIKKELNEPEGIASALKSIGCMYYDKGQYNQALIYHKKSLQQRKKIEYPAGIGESLSFIADTYKKMGEYDQAISCYKESLDIMEFIKDFQHASKILNHLGNIYRKKGEYAIALEFLKKAEKIKIKIKDFENLGYTLLEISSIYRWQSQYELALDYNNKSINLAKENNNKKLLANNLYYRSLLSINADDYKEAKKDINKAIKMAKANNYLNAAAKYLDCLGIIYRHEKKYKKALKIVEESLSISKVIGNRHEERKYLNSMGLVKEQTADYVGALNIYLKCLKLSKNINEKRSIAVSYNNIACVYTDLNELKLANKNFKKALIYSKRIKYKEGIAAYQFNIALVYGELKEYPKALKLIQSSMVTLVEVNPSNPMIISCQIYRTFLHFLQNDKKKVMDDFEEIKNINSDADIGYERFFELYQIYKFLDLDGSLFFKKAYYLLLENIKYIPSRKDKKYFINSDIRYNKSILEKWKSYNNN